MESDMVSNLQEGNSSPSFVFGPEERGDASRHLARAWEVLGVPIDVNCITEQLIFAWEKTRALVLAPLLRTGIFLCLVVTVLLLLEKLYVGTVSLVVKVFALKPEKRYKWEPVTADEEKGSAAYPMVLVQIPMYNEKEVYQLSIGAACRLVWPVDRMIIQVLDDSTDLVVKESIKMECQSWKSKGLNINYEIRDNRKGYKAGALKEGLKHDYVQECEYIAMFDADFQPESDFLARTIPFLVHNPEIALVQARWKFVNADECLLTRFQEMSLDYHFKNEQEAGSSVCAFFGFNGTAGVWRIPAITEAGGWQDRTTVEDMDLAVRAGLLGWKFIYVGDVKVKSELPSTFKAYRNQQHRWSCGPANLFKKMAVEIIQNKKISIWKKFHLIFNFFFIGKILPQTVTFIFYCVIIPAAALVPEVHIPIWGLVLVPTVTTLCKAVATPSSVHLVILWVLFENAMSFLRIKAALAGLLETKRVNEWVVTEKLGEAQKTKQANKQAEDSKLLGDARETTPFVIEKPKKRQIRFWHRFYFSEFVIGVFILLCGWYDVVHEYEGCFVFLFCQGLSFLVVGFGFVGTDVPSS